MGQHPGQSSLTLRARGDGGKVIFRIIIGDFVGGEEEILEKKALDWGENSTGSTVALGQTYKM